MPHPAVSVIVVFYDMQREAPRTLHTLSAAYQRGVTEADYEVIAIDNGSSVPLDPDWVKSFGPNFRLIRRDPSPSPVAAINAAVRESSGSAVMICIDGARMLSPGILRWTLTAFRAFTDPVVATLSWHLGPKQQNQSMLEGYDQTVEDQLLGGIDWRGDGYRLFDVSSFAASSKPGWFLPIGESNCLTVWREAYDRLGGFDERFQTPGGGLAVLDFYRRACDALPLVLLLGEGTFHQFHGGVATNAPVARHPFPTFHAEYLRIRGEPYALPSASGHFLGTMPPQCLRFLDDSVRNAMAARPAGPSA